MKPTRQQVRALQAAADAAWLEIEANEHAPEHVYDHLYRAYDDAVLAYLDAEDARAWFWTSKRRAALSNLWWRIRYRLPF